jgi:ADP-heptose:LPS heptosyltransferase
MHENDYPRAIELDLIRQALPDVHLVSVQQSNGFAARLGGVEYHSFKDFSDCAALMACCDEIVTIDTAAVHLAGAIGHPCVKLLLSHWASWRWLAPLYGNIKICRQDSAGDWASALGKL